MRNAAARLECSAVGQKALSAHIEGIKNQKGLSNYYRELSRFASAQPPDLQRFIETIQQKPCFTSNLIKLANTAYYAQPQKVNSVEAAIKAIGIKGVADIQLSLEILKEFGLPKGIDCERYWDHAVTVATLSRSIAEHNRLDGECAYQLALLHDLGLLVLARHNPPDFAMLMDQVESKGSIHIAAPDIINATHLEVTIELLKHWNFGSNLFSPLHLFPGTQQCAEVENHALSAVLYNAHKIAERNRYAFIWDILPKPSVETKLKLNIDYDFASGIGAALLSCCHN